MDQNYSEHNFADVPLKDIVRLGQRSLLNKNLFCVSWLLGRYCNYRCSYCWPYGRSDKKDHRPFSLIQKTMSEIKRQARERGFDSFHFSFSGGEPTLHPNYLELLQMYADDVDSKYQSVHMTTNLSAGKFWFKKYIAATKKLDRVSITASFHKEFANREQFADKLIFLQSNDVHVTINMVMVPDRFSELWDDALFFHKQNINVTLKPQSDEKAAKIVAGYTKEQLQLLKNGLPQKDYTNFRLNALNKESLRPQAFKTINEGKVIKKPIMQLELTDKNKKPWLFDQAERLNAFEFNKFTGWECSAGYRSIIIREPDGNIKRSYSCHDKPLGNIETGFELFPKPMPCISPSCVSSADSKIPKRKPGVKLPLWPGDKTYYV